MKKYQIMLVFGTRPEAIKMAPLTKVLEQEEKLEVCVCVTGQHRQMLDQVLDIFSIQPDFDLDIMKDKQTLSTITCSVIAGMERVIAEKRPDMILVHGDTSTSFAAALAAFYAQVPVGHVEAGLRTPTRYSPYPEEMNRRLTSRLAQLHFAPTRANRDNLVREHTDGEIYITGNTVIDALATTVKPDYRFKEQTLAALDLSGRVVLITAHRRENLGAGIRHISEAVRQLAQLYPQVKFIYPVHLNPAVRETVFSVLADLPNVYLIDPIDVQDMHNLMDRCYFVMTDSGGLQEEAPSLGKPVLVMRTETERPEAVEAGTVKVVGVERADIVAAARRLLDEKQAYEQMAQAVNPYGDGQASARIREAILHHFGEGEKPADFSV